MLYLNHILNNAKNAKIQYAVALRAADMWWCGVQSSHICVSSFFEVVQLLALSTFAHSYAVHFWVYLSNLRFRGPIQAKTSISFFAFRLCLLLNAVCTSLVHSARSNERSQKFRFATPTENDNNNDKRLKLTEPKLRIGRPPSGGLPTSILVEGKDEAERNAEFSRLRNEIFPYWQILFEFQTSSSAPKENFATGWKEYSCLYGGLPIAVATQSFFNSSLEDLFLKFAL